MPFPGPPPISETLPTCATAFLYQLGELFYYATEDCFTGATGTGVLGSLITPQGCDGAECHEGSQVDPFRLDAKAPAAGGGQGRGRRDPYGRSKSSQRQLKDQLGHFKGRADIVARRKDVADYLLEDAQTNGVFNLDRIFAQRQEIRDAYLEAISKELLTARIGAANAMTGIFATRDKDFDINTIGPEAIANLFTSAKTGSSQPIATVADGAFKKPGAQSPLLPYVKISTKGNPHTVDREVFFRLQHVTMTLGGAVHSVGQQIHENDLSQNEKANTADATWVDRHSHVHVINATPDGEAARDYFVYSAEDISASELVI